MPPHIMMCVGSLMGVSLHTMMCVGSCKHILSSPKIQLVVEFVDGVTRLELMKKTDELKVVAKN